MVNDPFVDENDDYYIQWKKLFEKYGSLLKDSGVVIAHFDSPDSNPWSAYAATTPQGNVMRDWDQDNSSCYKVSSDYSNRNAYRKMVNILLSMAYGGGGPIDKRSTGIDLEVYYDVERMFDEFQIKLSGGEKAVWEKITSPYKGKDADSIIPVHNRLFLIGSLRGVMIDGIRITRLLENAINNCGGGIEYNRRNWADYIVCNNDSDDYDNDCAFARNHGIQIIDLPSLLHALANTPELSKFERSRQLPTYQFSQMRKTAKQERLAAEKLEKKRLLQEKLRLELEEKEKRRQELRRQRDAETLRLLEEKEKERLEKEQLKRQEAERHRQEAEAREQLRKAAEAADRERRIRESDICRPGEEPANIRRRIDILFPKLDAAYPDRVISGLNKDHKKWGETVTELYRALGYPDSRAFLEAYGYTVAENRGGRPSTVDPAAVIKTLCERYPQGAGNVNVAILKADNPDLPLKTLENNAVAYFGCAFGYYLKRIGIIGNGEVRVPEITYEAAVTKEESIPEEAMQAAAERRRAVEEAWKAHDANVEKAKAESTEKPVVRPKAKPEIIKTPIATDSVPKTEDELVRVITKPETVNEAIVRELERENEAFEPTAILTIPEGTKKIDALAYAGRTDFDAVEIPDSVKTIGKGAFQGCTELIRVKLPGGLRTIPNDCFADCAKLQEVITGEWLQEIKLRAFARCVSLKKLRIPRGCWSISPAAFEGCVHAKITLQVSKGSFAVDYAKKQGFIVDEV